MANKLDPPLNNMFQNSKIQHKQSENLAKLTDLLILCVRIS